MSETTTETLGEAIPKEQARVRELLADYKALVQAAAFGAAMIEIDLKEMDAASGRTTHSRDAADAP